MNVEHVKSPSALPVLDPWMLGTIARLDAAAVELAQAQAAVDRLRARMARPRPVEAALPRMAAMLQACGVARPGTFEFAAALARIELQHRCGQLDLPASPADPRVTLVLSATSLDATVALLRRVAPDLVAQQAELLLADDGDEPGIAVLAATLRHLRVITGEDAVSACNLAAIAGRGTRVAWLEGEAAIDQWPTAGENEVLVGPEAADALARFGVSLGSPGGRAPGLRIMVPRDLWHAAGGLDPAMDDGGGLALADLCLKLRLLGARLTPLESERPASSRRVASARVWQAVESFRARWGDLGTADA